MINIQTSNITNITNKTSETKILVGISSCLIGNKVRYDGQHQYHQAINKLLADKFELVPFCPEMAIGLGVPRAKIQLVEVNQQIRCLDQASHQIDYTQQLSDICDAQLAQLKQLSGYIFKTKSPSCGLSQVKTDHRGVIRADGQGIFAKRLINLLPDLPIIEEHEFDNQNIQAEFMNAIYKYYQNHHQSVC